jgi:hypothetical protein
MRRMINVYRVKVEHLKGRNHLEEACGDGRIILKWILISA